MKENTEIYKRLGLKTLVIFVFQKSGILFLCVGAIVISIVLLQIVPPEYALLLNKIMGGIIVASVMIFAGIFSVAYATYLRYSIELTTDVLKIKRGFINEEEIGIPYRRIKDVKIERDVVDQLLGFVDLVFGVSHDEAVEVFLLVARVSGVGAAFALLDGSFAADGDLAVLYFRFVHS